MAGLKIMLTQIMDQALSHPGIPQIAALGGGLRVEVLVHSQQTYLHLSRTDNFPSLEEFQQVMARWPYPIKPPSPTPVNHSGRYYLTAAWHTPSGLRE